MDQFRQAVERAKKSQTAALSRHDQPTLSPSVPGIGTRTAQAKEFMLSAPHLEANRIRCA